MGLFHMHIATGKQTTHLRNITGQRWRVEHVAMARVKLGEHVDEQATIVAQSRFIIHSSLGVVTNIHSRSFDVIVVKYNNFVKIPVVKNMQS